MVLGETSETTSKLRMTAHCQPEQNFRLGALTGLCERCACVLFIEILVMDPSPCPFIPFCRYPGPLAGYMLPSRTELVALRVLVVDPRECGREASWKERDDMEDEAEL